MANMIWLGKWDLVSFAFLFSWCVHTGVLTMFDCCESIRKVQKSLADLEKLHYSNEGEHLFLPTAVGHNSHNKVLFFLTDNFPHLISFAFTTLITLIQVLKSQLFVEKYSESVQYTFLDYLTGGCELNFMVAIDFTGTHLCILLLIIRFSI